MVRDPSPRISIIQSESPLLETMLVILCGLLITYATSFDTDHIHKCRCLILIQIVRHSGGVIEFSDLYFLFI